MTDEISPELSLAVATLSDTRLTTEPSLLELVLICPMILCNVSINILIPDASVPISSVQKHCTRLVRSPCPSSIVVMMPRSCLLMLIKRLHTQVQHTHTTNNNTRAATTIAMMIVRTISSYNVFWWETALSMLILFISRISFSCAVSAVPAFFRSVFARFVAVAVSPDTLALSILS